MTLQDSYDQRYFIDTGGDYGVDTQSLDYNYQLSSLSLAKTQTQDSQLTHSDIQTVIG